MVKRSSHKPESRGLMPSTQVKSWAWDWQDDLVSIASTLGLISGTHIGKESIDPCKFLSDLHKRH